MHERKEWEEYEDAIFRYYEKQPNCKAKRNVHLKSPSGRQRQIDVLIEVSFPPDFVFTIAIEAKLYNRKLDSDTYDAIRTRLEGAGVDLGLIYCPHGLDPGPEKDLKASRNPRIELRKKSLEDVLTDNWGDDPFVAFKRLESAKKDFEPSLHVQEEVVPTIEYVSLYARYFLYNLESSAWVPILSNSGTFKRTLEGGTQIPPLLAGQYLCKFSREYPIEFLNFSKDLKTSYFWLESMLIDAASALDKNDRVSFLQIASHWPFRSEIHTNLVIPFLRSQIEAGLEGQTFDLLARMLDTSNLSLEPDSIFSSCPYWYKDIVTDFLPNIASYAEEQTIVLARTLIEDLINHANSGSAHVARRIEYHENFCFERDKFSEELILVLCYSYRDILQAVDVDLLLRQIESKLKDTQASTIRIFLRIELAAISKNSDVAHKAISTLIKNIALFFEEEIFNELATVVKNAWPSLGNDLKDRIIRDIYNFSNANQSDSSKLDQTNLWFSSIESFDISDEAKQIIRQFREENSLSRRPLPDFDIPQIRSGMVNEVPSEAHSLAHWTVDKVLDYCQTFQIAGTFLNRATPSGLASKLKEDVTVRPAEYLRATETVLRLKYPTYHSAILNGLSDALKLGSTADFEAITSLIRRLLEESRCYDPAVRVSDFDYGCDRWVKKSIADCLDKLTSQKTTELKLWEDWYSLCCRLLDTCNTSPGVEGDIDTMTEVINSEGGVLSMVMCRIAITSTRFLKSIEHSNQPSDFHDLARRSFVMIEQKLLSSSSSVLRSPCGLFFTHFYLLDREWTQRQADRIFDRSMPELWEGTWSCHFWTRQRFVEVFDFLRPEYIHALERFTDEGGHRREWFKRVGEDIGLFWMNDVIQEGDPLLTTFRNCNSARAKRAAVLQIYSILRESKGSETWVKARRWWSLNNQVSADLSDDDVSKTYLFWLDFVPSSVATEDLTPIIIAGVKGSKFHFHPAVWDFLVQRSSSSPEACAEVILEMSKNQSLSGWLSYEQKLKETLRLIHETSSSTALSTLREVGQNLLAQGVLELYDWFIEKFGGGGEN